MSRQRIALVTSLVSVLVGTGFAVASPAAADDGPMVADRTNASEVHMKARGKSCPEDFTLAKAQVTHKVTWKWPKRTGEKTLKKGKFACLYTGSDGVTQQGKFDKNGVLVALPSNFPKNPTAEDIKALGLTPDMKVSPDLRLPQPKEGSEFAAPVLPEKVTPVAVHEDKIFEIDVPAEGYWKYKSGYNPEGEKWWVETRAARTDRLFPVEVEYHGGEGVLMTSMVYDTDTGGLATMKAYELSPDKVTTVYYMFDAPEAKPSEIVITPNDGATNTEYFHVSGFIAPDYGQADAPASMLQGWRGYEEEGGIYERRARTEGQLKRSSMVSLGRWADSGRAVYGEPKDGYVYVSNLGNMIGVGGRIIPDYADSVKGPHPLPWDEPAN